MTFFQFQPTRAAGLVLALLCLPLVANGQATDAPEVKSAVFEDPASQYQFLVGDWDVDVTLHRLQGGDLRYSAHWHNHWLAKGQVLLQEWSGPYAQGVELRTWSTSKRHWEGRNIYLPSPAQWYENVAEWRDGEMVVTTLREGADGRRTLSRELYRSTDADRFSVRSEMSDDGGQTWREGRYRAEARRASD